MFLGYFSEILQKSIEKAMSSLHSLPVFGDQFQPTQAPAETAFNSTLQSYHLPPSTNQANTELAQFMLQHKPQIDSLIQQKLLQGSQKNQFSAHLQLRKPIQNEDQENELIVIYANSLTTPVYSQGLSCETYGREDDDSANVIFLYW